jgi:hypothetical protein
MMTGRPENMLLDRTGFGLQQDMGCRDSICGGDQSDSSDVSMQNAIGKRGLLTILKESRWSARLDRELLNRSAVII